MWNATEYLKFADERARPFFDLVGQVRLERAGTIADLGCGPGNLTRTLTERWPMARVVGIDSSPEMLERAGPLAIPGRLEFVQADIADWSPAEPVDLIVSNAALQWISDHRRLLARLAGALAAGGTLAVQMPHRFDNPSQAAIEETSADPRWADLLKGVGLHRKSVMSVTWYVSELMDLGFAVNAWETTYVHVLRGKSPVLDWLKGTGLRPLPARLDEAAQGEFLRILGERFQQAYPPQGDVTLFPMPRVFFVATKAA